MNSRQRLTDSKTGVRHGVRLEPSPPNLLLHTQLGLEARVGIEPTHKAFEVKLELEQFKGVRVQKTAQRGRGGRAFPPYAGQERTVVLEKTQSNEIRSCKISLN